jgi:ketosteroid isomerase-like protein
MRRIFVALSLGILAVGSAAASEKDAVTAPVHQFIDGFNKGDTKTAVAACADETSIIDEFPPYEWHGSGACAKWAADFAADTQKNAITDGHVALAAPRHVDITGDRAYVVVPATYTFKMKGKPVKESGSVLTVALRKGDAGWRIAAWTWAKH